MMLLLTGFGLVTGGMAVAFLMVIQILNPSFVLSFLSYGASVIGLVLGVSAAIQHGSFRFRERG